MDNDQPIITIKVTTDNVELLEYIFNLIIVTLFMLNINIVLSICNYISNITLQIKTRNNIFFRQVPLYSQLQNEID